MLLAVLVSSLGLLIHGMKQTGFCSQAWNIGKFGQDLLKPAFNHMLSFLWQHSEAAFFYFAYIHHGSSMQIHSWDLIWKLSTAPPSVTQLGARFQSSAPSAPSKVRHVSIWLPPPVHWVASEETEMLSPLPCSLTKHFPVCSQKFQILAPCSWNRCTYNIAWCARFDVLHQLVTIRPRHII